MDNKFSENSYVVCTGETNTHKSFGWVKNLCLKISDIKESCFIYYFYDYNYGVFESQLRAATEEEIAYYENVAKKPFDITEMENKQQIILKNFPSEGLCRTLDERLIEYLSKNRKYSNPKMKKKATAVAWTNMSIYYIGDPEKSFKIEYKLEELDKFLPKGKKIEESFNSNYLGSYLGDPMLIGKNIDKDDPIKLFKTDIPAIPNVNSILEHQQPLIIKKKLNKVKLIVI